MTDAQFITTLTAYLREFNSDPVVPLFKKDDGFIDRDKTLALPCYAGLNPV